MSEDGPMPFIEKLQADFIAKGYKEQEKIEKLIEKLQSEEDDKKLIKLQEKILEAVRQYSELVVIQLVNYMKQISDPRTILLKSYVQHLKSNGGVPMKAKAFVAAIEKPKPLRRADYLSWTIHDNLGLYILGINAVYAGYRGFLARANVEAAFIDSVAKQIIPLLKQAIASHEYENASVSSSHMSWSPLGKSTTHAKSTKSGADEDDEANFMDMYTSFMVENKDVMEMIGFDLKSFDADVERKIISQWVPLNDVIVSLPVTFAVKDLPQRKIFLGDLLVELNGNLKNSSKAAVIQEVEHMLSMWDQNVRGALGMMGGGKSKSSRSRSITALFPKIKAAKLMRL